MSVQAATSK